MNTLSDYIYFYISKNITSYTFLLVFIIVESLQCILNKRVNTEAAAHRCSMVVLKIYKFPRKTSDVNILLTEVDKKGQVPIVVRDSPREVFLGKDVLKICSKFTGEHSCRMKCDFNKVA